jgi:hypothetical protein
MRIDSIKSPTAAPATATYRRSERSAAVTPAVRLSLAAHGPSEVPVEAEQQNGDSNEDQRDDGAGEDGPGARSEQAAQHDKERVKRGQYCGGQEDEAHAHWELFRATCRGKAGMRDRHNGRMTRE